MKIIFSSGESLPYNYDIGISEIVAYYETFADAVKDAAMYTEENIQHIILQTDDGKVTGEYYNLLFENVSISSPRDSSGGHWVLFVNLREKTKEENRLERIEHLLSTQDGAIGDLADTIAEIIGG